MSNVVLLKSDFLSCDQCSYIGTKLRNLEKHKLSQHDGVRYKCDQCSYKGTQKISLNAHKRFVHEGICHEPDKCSYTGISLKNA